MMGIFDYSGDEPFGCEHCAGMGYMDYPSNQRPCIIPGHVEQYERNLSSLRVAMKSLERPYSPSDGNCPYCLALGRPTGISCKHWTGLGWSKAGRW